MDVWVYFTVSKKINTKDLLNRLLTANIDDIYRECDYITIHIPYIATENKGLINAGLIRKMKDGVVICHSEGYKRGIASNHGDVMHWFPKHGKNMNPFRADVKTQLAKLTESSSKPETTTVTAYKLVVDVPVYTTAADAKDRVNSKSVYKAGTYYIYNKYPNGLNGMLNITKDTSGAAAGGWINPADNIKQEAAETPQLYRVRKSWADTKSQKGAFSSLDNAKACCQEAGDGYKVYDNTSLS